MDVVVKEEIMEHGEQIPIKIEKPLQQQPPRPLSEPIPVIELSSSDSDYSSDDSDAEANYARVSNGGPSQKKQKLDNLGIVLPAGFLDPLPPEEPLPLPAAPIRHYRNPVAVFSGGSKQFWKAGDYEDSSPLATAAPSSTVGMDHVRVHPKFLHSNATSHKWALGAFAELLDNALDEVFYGATFVNVDMLENKKDGSRMLLIEDNGGGMDPDKMRQCMSLGYSAKSKMANVIGQYGNGFKTSTMRLGADVIVFSRCRGKDGKSSTQSIGMLSYTFLRSTAKEDIVVPMLDYEKVGREWNKLMRSSKGDWDINAETVVQWSPYSSETELLQQFSTMSDQGTRILIYNLWEDDQGELELDFDTDQHDIQIRGVNRDEKKIEMAKQFPNSRHFLTYRNSLRSYAAILYLRLPPRFRIVLRGKDVDHHNIVNDLMLTERITYRPQPGADGVPKDASMVAIVTVGFVKDAKDHIDVQGFNVYHKNRLIKPFWRVWNAAGSDGRGVIGVLEANFVEPAHDKQGFERTTVLSRLESRLVQMQKTYWSTNCHKIGYAPRRQKKLVNEAAARESSPDYSPYQSSRHSKKYTPYQDKYSTLRENPNGNGSILSPNSRDLKHGSGHVYSNGHSERQTGRKYGDKSSSSEKAVSIAEENGDSEMQTIPSKEPPNSSNYKDSPAQTSLPREHSHKDSPAQTSLPREHSHNTHSFSQNSGNSEVGRNQASNGVTGRVTRSQLKEAATTCNGGLHDPVYETIGLNQLKVENSELKDRLKKMEESYLRDLEVERDKNKSLEALVNGDSDLDASSQSQLKVENHKLKNSLKKLEDSFLHDLQYERDRCKSLEAQLKESEQKIEEMNKEQEALIDIFSEERSRRDSEEENLRKKLKDASNTIQQLLDKVRQLENLKSQNYKTEGRV